MRPRRAATHQALAACASLIGWVWVAGQPSAIAQVQTQRQEQREVYRPGEQALAPKQATQAKGGALLDAPAPSAQPTPEPEPPAHAAAWLRQVNAIRAAGANCGGQAFAPVAPLRWNALLEQAAVLHSRDQAGRNRLGHEGSDGSDIGERMGRQGYAWQAAGENVAAGQATMAAAIVGWLNSPGHCRNMMGPQFKDMGLGQAGASGIYSAYYTMVLGAGGGGAAANVTAAQAQERDPKAALAFINNLRAQGGTCGKVKFLPSRPLQWEERLNRVASWDALNKVGRKAADDPGSDLSSRFRSAGFLAGRSTAMGGNGGAAPLVSVGGLMGSEANCVAFLSDSYTHMGFAGAQEQSGGNAGRWWWTLVLANDMYGGRIGPTGPVDRSRTDHALALEVVNAFRSKGLTCKGEDMPPVPPVSTHPVLEAAIQAVADGRSGPPVNWAGMLSSGGLDWSGGAQAYSGFSSHGAALAIEDWVTGSYCKAFLSPKLKYVGARVVATTEGQRPGYWHVILVNGK